MGDVSSYVEKDIVENYPGFNSISGLELADKFVAEELDLLEFMNELTYMWPDYSEYSYSSNSFFISFFRNLSTPKCFIGSVSTAILYTTVVLISKHLKDILVRIFC